MRVGYLSADAEPWATVLLDGRPLDRTPLSRFPVPIGKHTLVFRSADGLEETRPVSVEEGKVITVRLEGTAPGLGLQATQTAHAGSSSKVLSNGGSWRTASHSSMKFADQLFAHGLLSRVAR